MKLSGLSAEMEKIQLIAALSDSKTAIGGKVYLHVDDKSRHVSFSIQTYCMHCTTDLQILFGIPADSYRIHKLNVL